MAGAAIAIASQLPLILSLIEAGTEAVVGLTKIADKVHRGEELSEDDRNLLKREQAAAKARFDTAVTTAAGIQSPDEPGIPDGGPDAEAPPLPGQSGEAAAPGEQPA